MKKKFCAAALSTLFAATALAVTGCNADVGDDEKQAYVSLDINPAIELIVDRNNNVISVRGENEDGLVLLYEETGIAGEKIDVAVKKITDLAVKYGYLDEDNKVVDMLVSSSDSAFAAELSGKIDASVTATAANLGLTVTVDGEGAYSLIRKMNEIKEQFPDNSAVANASAQKFKLALAASGTGEISVEAAVALDDSKLIEMLKSKRSEIDAFATTAYAEAKARAEAAYEQAAALAAYGAYAEFYMEKMLTHPTTVYYGAVYRMYASAAKGFEVICDVAELANEAKRYPLDEEQVEKIATALGMESTDALKNSDGEITVESIEAYADKLFKNSPASEELEKTKAALTDALSEIEAAVKQKAAELGEKYKPQIDQAAESARRVVEAVNNVMNAMPESVKNIVNAATKDLNDVLAALDDVLSDGKIELDELKDIAAGLEGKAQEYLERMKADLSDDEWAELEQKKTAAVEKLTAQKQQFEKALDDAAKAAKARLAELKEARKTK